MNKIKKWYCENKDKPLFKAKLLLVAMIILAVAVQIFTTEQDNRKADRAQSETSVTEEAAEAETAEEETEESFIMVFYKNSRAHIVVLAGLSAALAAVQIRKKHKLKESR